MFISLDALFGCVRKVSAGTSVRPPNHGETLFIEQAKVDSFLKNYQGKSLKSQVCIHLLCRYVCSMHITVIYAHC